MTNSATQAVQNAKATRTNRPGMCQAVTRGWLGGPSAGDVDHDGDADAVDGWKSEPASKRHTDKNPPAGAPVAWSGGSGGFGHRALSLGNGLIRSTDAGGRGVVATKPIDWFEQNWHLHYLGWSETISGQPIPSLKIPARPTPPRKPKPKKTRGKVVDQLVKDIKRAKKGAGERAKQLTIAEKALHAVPFLTKEKS